VPEGCLEPDLSRQRYRPVPAALCRGLGVHRTLDLNGGIVIKIADYINGNRDAIIDEWVAVADALTPRNLSTEELLDAVREMLDSIVHALETASSDRPFGSGPPVAVVKSPELAEVAKAHAAHRFTQRFTLAQMAAEYRALRTNVTRRWLAQTRGETDAARELAQFNAAVDWSMASAVGWYDARLRKQQDDLKTADRNKDEFLAVLGHELRNPLSPLRTGMDIWNRAPRDHKLLDSVRPMMERQLSHLSRLVDDLLDFARIRHGEIQLDVVAFDLNAAIETAIEQSAAPIGERRQELVVKLFGSPLPVLGDFDRLTQVISNLLSNASKYTEEGGQITVMSDVENDRAAVRVVDCGYGIPPAHLENIFELFTQLPEHRQKTGGGGLGIGLALARRLVEMHDGRIEAASEGPGSGSEFHVTLPLHLRDARTEGVSDEAPARSCRAS
jgi:signal transduction histidine kinase